MGNPKFQKEKEHNAASLQSFLVYVFFNLQYTILKKESNDFNYCFSFRLKDKI